MKQTGVMAYTSGVSRRAMDSEEHLVGCRTAGVVRCRTVRRRPIEEQFDQQLMLALRGRQWDAKGRLASPNDGRISTSDNSSSVHPIYRRRSGDSNGSSTRHRCSAERAQQISRWLKGRRTCQKKVSKM
eukprot:5681545-Amphidinium_carterae.1